MSNDPSALGRKINQARKAKDLTAYEVAKRTGIVHRATVQRIESGEIVRPKPETLQQLAEVLDLDLDDLLALAGYARAEDLPDFEPYLRAKHSDLPEDAMSALIQHFELIADKYRRTDNQ